MLLLTEIFSQLVSCHGDQTEITCFTYNEKWNSALPARALSIHSYLFLFII